MNILFWIIFGIVVGVIGQAIDPDPRQGGMLGAILLGIVGALLGGFIAELLLGLSAVQFNLVAFFIAAVGAIVVLIFGRFIARV